MEYLPVNLMEEFYRNDNLLIKLIKFLLSAILYIFASIVKMRDYFLRIKYFLVIRIVFI